MKKLILISGKAESGKDLTAKLIKGFVGHDGHTALIVHYADYLKFIASEYYNAPKEKSDKTREIWQQLGTEKARKNNPDIWVAVINEFIKAVGNDFDYILVPDTRFPNEIEYMKDQGYNVETLRVRRIGHENALTSEQRLHQSEIALDDYKFGNYISYNNDISTVAECASDYVKEVLYGSD